MVNNRNGVIIALAAILLGTSCGVDEPGSMSDEAKISGNPAIIDNYPPKEVEEIRPGLLAGYLQPDALPNGILLIPPVAELEAVDTTSHAMNLALQGSSRWQWAERDANLDFPAAVNIFFCAANFLVEPDTMPHLVMLLRRSLTDAALSTRAAKNHHQRARPFLTNQQPICVPEDIESLKPSFSYPSGHAAVGWTWALILVEIVPDRANQILARGRAFGESRAICNVHWSSDVSEARTLGAATFASLHANPVFMADLALAKQEVTQATKMLPAKVDCAAESKALGIVY